MNKKTKHTINTSNKTKNKSQKKTKKALRPSPSESATSLPEGSIRRGGNGSRWVIVRTSKGIPRWVPVESCELNGWRALTVDYLAKNIGKSVEIYEREYMDTWLAKNEKMDKLKFIPSGALQIQINRKKTLAENWLATRKPAIHKGQMLSLLGLGDWYGTVKEMKEFYLQIDSGNGKLVSSNVMNREAFVKV
jgi:hypothetical protein